MKKMKEWITAEELSAKLEADPEYIERTRQYDEELEKRWAARKAAMAPLMEELHASGCSLSSSGYLTNQPNIAAAVSIVLAHLQRTTYPPDARARMAQVLNVPDVKPHWDLLVQLYRDEREERVKDGLANAIVAASDDAVLDEVIALVRDKRHGTCRVLLMSALEKTKDPRGRATIEELATDPDLALQVRVSLKRLDRKKQKQAERQAQKKQIQKKPTHH